MKVVFLYMSKGSGPEDLSDVSWKEKQCGEIYQEFSDEGYFQLLEDLVDQKIITDLKVFFESNIQPGKASFVKGADCWVVPNICHIDQFIEDDTIIFVRGGFRHWHDWLLKYKGKNWLMIYAANTGREKWPWWDIVLDDLGLQNTLDSRGRYQFPFIKPVKEKIFFPTTTIPDYDICIGASNIHDKKGQWRGVKLVEKFRELYGYYPRSIMPGALRRSKETLSMLETDFYRNILVSPGFLTRSQLAKVFNRTRIFLHLGHGGQNDRSAMEALACGCTVVVANPSRFTPMFSMEGMAIHHFNMDRSFEWQAIELKNMIDRYDKMTDEQVLFQKAKNKTVYLERMGYEFQSLARMAKLFKSIKGVPPVMENKEALAESFKKIMRTSLALN